MSTPSITELKATWGRKNDLTNRVSQAGIGLLADGRRSRPLRWRRSPA